MTKQEVCLQENDEKSKSSNISHLFLRFTVTELKVPSIH